jgi:hypothetical protein
MYRDRYRSCWLSGDHDRARARSAANAVIAGCSFSGKHVRMPMAYWCSHTVLGAMQRFSHISIRGRGADREDQLALQTLQLCTRAPALRTQRGVRRNPLNLRSGKISRGALRAQAMPQSAEAAGRPIGAPRGHVGSRGANIHGPGLMAHGDAEWNPASRVTLLFWLLEHGGLRARIRTLRAPRRARGRR